MEIDRCSYREDSLGASRVREKRGKGDKGMSLIEVLVSMLLLMVALVGGLQCLGRCLQLSHAAQKHWRDTLDTWNRSQVLRAQSPAVGDPIVIVPDARPMLESTLEGEGGPTWEILRAPK